MAAVFLVLFSLSFWSYDAFATSISVTPGPFQVAVDQITHELYVSNSIHNTVIAINGSTNTVTTTIPVGLAPFGVAVNQNTQLVYVANEGSGTVSVIDELSNTVVATIPVGAGPVALAINPNNGIIYASNLFSGTVSVINSTTNTLTSTLTLAFGVGGIAIDPILDKVYIGNISANIVYVINATNNTVIKTIAVGNAPTYISINPNDHLVYVPNANANTISVINGTTDTIVNTISTGEQVTFATAVNPNTKTVYAANSLSNTVTVINGTTNSIMSVFPTDPGPSGLAVDSGLNKAYVTNSKFNTISVIDITTNPPVAIAGPDQSVLQGDLVSLDGSASFSLSGSPLAFNWTQTTGPAVVLSNSAATSPTFTAPSVGVPTLLTFKLIVNDGTLDSAPSTVRIVDNPARTFIVPLNPVNGSFSGSVNVGDIFNGTSFALQYRPPPGALPTAQFQQSNIPPGVDRPNVGFNVTESQQVPNNIPPPPINTAAFFNINSTGVDFSNPSNFAPNQVPKTKFLVAHNFTSAKRFADGCPVVPLEVFNENTQKWDQVGDPLATSTKILIGNVVSGTISVIDTSLNKVVKTIAVPGGVQGEYYNPNNNALYVANPFSNSVTAIDATSYNTIAVIPVGISPLAVNLDSKTHLVYVANPGSNSISVINDTTNTVVATILGIISPQGLTVNSNTHRLYASNFVTGTVSVVNTTSNLIIGVIPVGLFPTGLSVDPASNRIYVDTSFGGIVVINGNTNTVIDTIIPRGTPVIDSNNKIVYSVQSGFNSVGVIDSSVDTKIASVPVGIGARSGSVNPTTDRLYVTNAFSNTVSVIDGMPGSPTQNSVLATIPVGSGPFQARATINSNIPNPIRDPSTDVTDGFGNILECSYIAQHPHLSKFAIGGVVALFVGGSGQGASTSFSLSTQSFIGNLPEAIKQQLQNHDPFATVLPSNDPSVPYYPLAIDGQGYLLGGYANTIQTAKETTGNPVDLKFTTQVPSMQHMAIYFTPLGIYEEIKDSDTYVIYEKGEQLQIVDPHGYFSHVNILTSNNGLQHSFDFSITFANHMEKSNIIVRAWDEQRHSSDTKIWNAIQVDSTQKISSNLPDQAPSDQIVNVLAQTTTPSTPDLLPAIKDWAGYSSHAISNSEFLADIGINGQSIPQWVSKTTKYVVDGDLSIPEFENMLNYLADKGIVK